MDKILQSTSGDVQVTNDGATILESIHIDNAAAKVRASPCLPRSLSWVAEASLLQAAGGKIWCLALTGCAAMCVSAPAVPLFF